MLMKIPKLKLLPKRQIFAILAPILLLSYAAWRNKHLQRFDSGFQPHESVCNESDPTFFAIRYFRPAHRISDIDASVGHFTCAGPMTETLFPLPIELDGIATIPECTEIYGYQTRLSSIYRVDPENQILEQYPLNDIDARFERRAFWRINGIAYDSQRDRVVSIVRQNDDFVLVSYDPKDETWYVRDINLPDRIRALSRASVFGALTYSASHDRLYGIYVHHTTEPIVLTEMTHDGDFLRTIPLEGGLTHQFFERFPRTEYLQLASVEGNLMLVIGLQILAPHALPSGGAKPRFQQIYRIDLEAATLERTF